MQTYAHKYFHALKLILFHAYTHIHSHTLAYTLIHLHSICNGSDPNKDTACIISVEGRQYPVDILYTKHPSSSYVQSVLETVNHIHRTQPPGDVLVFMSGREEIDKVVMLLQDGDTEYVPCVSRASLRQ